MSEKPPRPAPHAPHPAPHPAGDAASTSDHLRAETRPGSAHRQRRGPADEHTSTPAVPRRCRQCKPEPGPAEAAGTGAALSPGRRCRRHRPRPGPWLRAAAAEPPRTAAQGAGPAAHTPPPAASSAAPAGAPAGLRGRCAHVPEPSSPAAADRPGLGPPRRLQPLPPAAARLLIPLKSITSETRAPSPAPRAAAAAPLAGSGTVCAPPDSRAAGAGAHGSPLHAHGPPRRRERRSSALTASPPAPGSGFFMLRERWA